ncbi:MAG: hypothetical protein HYU51_11370 [Candidatus Rokubacteria bacterium]|nr:hypothetical protein [Candidatus Rokubacteria bacterium]
MSVEVLPEPAGHMVVQSGRPGVVVAAPHGTSDPNTGDIAAAISRRTGFGLVVATGFVLEQGRDGRPVRRYQVNRPLESVPGRGPADERVTVAAQRVYDEYERRVHEAAGGRLAFYVEIHGNSRTDTAGRIEIATVGVDRDHALQLKALLELTRDAHLRGHPEVPALAALVEPADTVFYAAGGAKREGILRLAERALHLELPRAARREFREVYTVILSDFLGQAVTLRPLR